MSTPQSAGFLAHNFLKMNGLSMAATRPEQVDAAPEYIHPILTTANFRDTIANYNKQVHKYNLQVALINKPVHTYNKQVILFRRSEKPTVEQKIREQLWKDRNKGLSPEAYNEAVEAYNDEHGPQLRKKPLKQPVKPETEKYFVSFLHQYNMQLFRRKENFQKLGVYCPAELPKLELYPNKVVEAERDGCKTLAVCKDSVRHHRERMEEAGIFLDSQFCGPNRPVKLTLNPDILSLTDNQKAKKTAAGNQQVTEEITNKVGYNNVSSRKNSLEKNKNRESGDAEKASIFNATKKTTKKPKERASGPRTTKQGNQADFSPKNELSAVLISAIDDKTTLARDLSEGKHATYTPISPKISQQEAYYGAMHPEDFKELAIQDIFKAAASLFSQLDVHPGSWMNAYKYWLADKFCSFNGHTMSKPNIFEHWTKAIAVLREVKKYQKNNREWSPRFPSLYFDPARTFKENNSFEYALRFFRLDDKKTTPYKTRQINAHNSLRKKTDVKKAQEKIREFFREKIDLQDVYNYVWQNCSKEVHQNINELINKEFKTYFNSEI